MSFSFGRSSPTILRAGARYVARAGTPPVNAKRWMTTSPTSQRPSSTPLMRSITRQSVATPPKAPTRPIPQRPQTSKPPLAPGKENIQPTTQRTVCGHTRRSGSRWSWNIPTRPPEESKKQSRRPLQDITSRVPRHDTSSYRRMHTWSSNRSHRAVVVSAANSKISQETIAQALEDDVDVYAFTGNKEQAQSTLPRHPGLNLVEIEHGDYQDPRQVERALKETLERRTYDQIGVISTLGGTTSTPGKPDSRDELREKNIKAPQGFVRGALRATRSQSGMQNVTHLSSITAPLSPSRECDYAEARRTGEKVVSTVAFDEKAGNVTHLRVGLVQAPPRRDPKTGEMRVYSGHNHSAENWNGYHVIPVAGKDEQPVQQPVSLTCVAEGALKASFRTTGPNLWEVHGVSRDILTQREYLSLFTARKKIVCIHVPLDILQAMTKLASDGRLQPYAIHVLRALETQPQRLDPTDFETLLGRKADTLDKIYKPLENTDFKHNDAGIFRYLVELLRSCFTNREDAIAFVKTILFARGWEFSLLKKK